MDNTLMPHALPRPTVNGTHEKSIIIRAQGRSPTPQPSPSLCACMQCVWRTLRGSVASSSTTYFTYSVAIRAGVTSQRTGSGRRPHLRGKPHHLRKSRRAKCALHWHSPEQKMPILVSTGLGHCRSQLSHTISLRMATSSIDVKLDDVKLERLGLDWDLSLMLPSWLGAVGPCTAPFSAAPSRRSPRQRSRRAARAVT